MNEKNKMTRRDFITDFTLIFKKGINFWTILLYRAVAYFNNHSFSIWNFSVQSCQFTAE